MGPIVYPSDLCVPQTETHCLELPGRGVVMSQAKSPPSLFPGWLLPSHQVKSHCAGSRPEEGVEYKRNREEKHQWRIGDLSWYEGGDIFSATVQEYSLFKSEQMPPDGTSGAFFGILTQMKSSLQMSWLMQVYTCICHSSPAP